MNSRQPNNKKKANASSKLIEVGKLAKELKPGEVKQLGEDVYIIPVFPLNPPKKPGKGKSRKK